MATVSDTGTIDLFTEYRFGTPVQFPGVMELYLRSLLRWTNSPRLQLTARDTTKGSTNDYLEGQTKSSHSFKHSVLLRTTKIGACLLVYMLPIVVVRSYIFELR
jgi:hypothetical protein